jgi:hypothetical protein
MSVQIVISGNRVLGYGTDFSVTGNAVECASTGRVYNNATIATVESVPDDIGSVGYEYHAGRFVPCGPFGVGKGNVAVVCNDDCKALKDSGVPMESFAASEYTTYKCDEKASVSLTFNISPDVAFITTYDSDYEDIVGLILGDNFISISSEGAQCELTVDRNGNTISWARSSGSRPNICCANGKTYQVYAFSVKGAH